MEENGSDVIEMAVEGEEAAAGLVGPNLDLIVVTARDEEGLRPVEVNSAHRTIVFFESINQCSHAVIP